MDRKKCIALIKSRYADLGKCLKNCVYFCHNKPTVSIFFLIFKVIVTILINFESIQSIRFGCTCNYYTHITYHHAFFFLGWEIIK